MTTHTFAMFLAIGVAVLVLVRRTAHRARLLITPVISRSVKREAALIQRMQALRCAPLTTAVDGSVFLVSHAFYIVNLPLLLWLGLPMLCVKLTLFMSVVNYLGQYVKDYFCAPRPLHLMQADVRLRGLNQHASREYGLPSVHVSNTWGFFGGLIVLQTASGALRWPWPGALASLLALALTAFVAAGRMYSYMHSLTDVLGGFVLASMALVAFHLSLSRIDEWLAGGPVACLHFLAAVLALLWLYPRPARETPSFGDAVVFLGAAGGIMLGVTRAPGLHQTPPFDVHCAQHWRVMLLQTLLCTVIAVAAKEACRAVSQPALLALLGLFPRSVRRLWQFPVRSCVAAPPPVSVDADGLEAVDSEVTTNGAGPPPGEPRTTNHRNLSTGAARTECAAAVTRPHHQPGARGPADVENMSLAGNPTRTLSHTSANRTCNGTVNGEASSSVPLPPQLSSQPGLHKRRSVQARKDAGDAKASSSGDGMTRTLDSAVAGAAAADELPTDVQGRNYDAVHLSRLLSYWALGWAASELAPRFFGWAGLARD